MIIVIPLKQIILMYAHNLALSDHLNAIAYYEEKFKIPRWEYRAKWYIAAAQLVRELSYEVLTIAEAKSYKGIGAKISKRVEEFAKTGTSRKLDKLRARDPVRDAIISQLTSVKGIGIYAANVLYDKNIRSIEAIRQNASASSFIIAADNVFPLLEDSKKNSDRILHVMNLYLDNAIRFSEIIPREEIFSFQQQIRDALPSKIRMIVVGGYRRGRLVSEIDLLFTYVGDELIIMRDILIHLKLLFKEGMILTPTVFRGMSYKNRLINARLFKEESYPYALFHMTGPYSFVTEARIDAENMGNYMSEYGLTDSLQDRIELATERELFYSLDRSYLPPNARIG